MSVFRGAAESGFRLLLRLSGTSTRQPPKLPRRLPLTNTRLPNHRDTHHGKKLWVANGHHGGDPPWKKIVGLESFSTRRTKTSTFKNEGRRYHDSYVTMNMIVGTMIPKFSHLVLHARNQFHEHLALHARTNNKLPLVPGMLPLSDTQTLKNGAADRGNRKFRVKRQQYRVQWLNRKIQQIILPNKSPISAHNADD